MPDQVPGGARRGCTRSVGWPIGRAAPTRPAVPGVAAPRSRRWLVVLAGLIAAALLAGASVALAATSSGSGQSAPAPAATHLAPAGPGAGPGRGLSDL